MAQDTLTRFNFYKRYIWQPGDFEDLQDNFTGALTEGTSEGIFKGAVLFGGGAGLDSGLDLGVSPLIATNSTGKLLVNNEGAILPAFSVPGAGLGARHLVVARPVTTDAVMITRPTLPFDLVPLKEIQSTSIVVIAGSPSSQPVYPSTQDGDVVLFGVRISHGDSALTLSNIDYEIRDAIGKNSDLHRQGFRWDDRLRPYRQTMNTVGIRPSQILGYGNRMFTFLLKGRVSLFPKGSDGKFSALDTQLDFQDGAISGGDAFSPTFTPVIPASGMFRVATIAIHTDDSLEVVYGTLDGTFDQCVAAIQNRQQTGAGNVSLLKQYLIAFVIVGSLDGTNVSSVDIMDLRPSFNGGGTETSEKREVPTRVNSTDFTLSLPPITPDGVKLFFDGVLVNIDDYTINGQTVSFNSAGLGPSTGQKFESIYLIEDNGGTLGSGVGQGQIPTVLQKETPTDTVDGSNAVFHLTKFPITSDSVMPFVDGVLANDEDYTVVGKVVTFVPSEIPKTGQKVRMAYLIQGTASTPGGGGSGTQPQTDYIVITSDMVTNQALTLSATPFNPGDVEVTVKGGEDLFYGDDFVVSGDTLSWNVLGSGMGAEATVGSKVKIAYFI